jgi:hypothetical protein
MYIFYIIYQLTWNFSLKENKNVNKISFIQDGNFQLKLFDNFKIDLYPKKHDNYSYYEVNKDVSYKFLSNESYHIKQNNRNVEVVFGERYFIYEPINLEYTYKIGFIYRVTYKITLKTKIINSNTLEYFYEIED